MSTIFRAQPIINQQRLSFWKIVLHGISDKGELPVYLGVEVQASQEDFVVAKSNTSVVQWRDLTLNKHLYTGPSEEKENLVDEDDKTIIDNTFDYRVLDPT